MRQHHPIGRYQTPVERVRNAFPRHLFPAVKRDLLIFHGDTDYTDLHGNARFPWLIRVNP
jgi:hypothetical protein